MTDAPKEDAAFEYRTAKDDDGEGILTVLKEVAPEIPVTGIDTPEGENAAKIVIKECCDSGESWVALDADGAIVGFVLAKADRLERFHKENEALTLPYAGVAESSRRNGIFATLMETVMHRGVPLTAVVLNGNKSGMVDRLTKIGFTKTGSDDKQIKLRWEARDLPDPSIA